MPVNSDAVGRSVGPQTVDLDPRFLMAFAAGIGEVAPHYYDTTRPDGIIGHPVYPVSPEWDLARLSDEPLPGMETLVAGEAALGVHYDHRILIHRPLRGGDKVALSATLTGVEQRRSGALHLLQYEASDSNGQPLWTTIQGALFRGVDVSGGDRRVPQAIDAPDRIPADAPALQTTVVKVPYGTPHVYTECSRIWNPIHTDEAVAIGAGLPGIILHGTATLALAVSALLRLAGESGPERVRDLYGRFAAMVPLPDMLTVRILADETADGRRTLRYDVRNGAGDSAIRDGQLVLAHPAT